MLEIINNILIKSTPVLGTLLTKVITGLLNGLRTKVKREKGEQASKIIDHIASQVVIDLKQTIVDKIKNVEKRKLRDKDKKAIKYMAIENTKYILTEKVKKDAKSIVKDVDKYIGIAIENEIEKNKEKME